MTTGTDPAGSSNADSPFPLSRKIKLALWAACVVLVGIITWQNWVNVKLKILFVDIEMPRTILVLLILAIGFLTGLATPSLWARRKRAA